MTKPKTKTQKRIRKYGTCSLPLALLNDVDQAIQGTSYPSKSAFLTDWGRRGLEQLKKDKHGGEKK